MDLLQCRRYRRSQAGEKALTSHEVAQPQGIQPGARGDPLIERIRAGDRKAIAQFVDLHADLVYAYVHRRLDRAELTDDLVQEVFLAAWSQLGSFRGDSEIGTWLLGIARHKIGDYYRTRFEHIVWAEDEPDPPSGADWLDIDESLDGQRRAAKTRDVLALLPDAYRAVLIWRYWDERSLSEMATITGKSAKAIERLLARARWQFRLKWNQVEA